MMGGKRREGTGEGRRERAPLTQIPGSAPGSVSISWLRVTVHGRTLVFDRRAFPVLRS